MLTGNQTRIGYGRNNVWTGSQVIQVGRSDMVGLIVKGTTSQSANLMEWRNVSNSLVASLSASGSFTIAQLTGSASQTVIATGNGWRFTPGSAANPPIVARGAASQSGNLQEWQDSAGTVLSYVNSSGGLYGSTLTLTGTTVSLTSGSDISFTASGGSSAITLWARGGGATAPKLQLGNAGNTSTLTGTTLSITSPSAASVVFVVQGASSQSGNLQEWRDSSGTAGAVVNASRNFSNTGGQSASEIFGAAASVSGTNAVAIGGAASATSGGVAIGYGATVSGNSGIAIGQSCTAPTNSIMIGTASTSGSNAIAIGNGAIAAHVGICIGVSSTDGGNSVVVGNSVTSGSEAIHVGASHSSCGSYDIGLGFMCNFNSYTGVILMGRRPTANGANRFIAGTSLVAINDVFFGKGDIHATPTVYTINGTGGSGTDIAGANIAIAGGKGTGTGVGGNVLLQTSLAGSTGASLNSLTTIATISQTTQNVLIQTSAAATKGLVVKGTASQSANLAEFQDSSGNNIFAVSSDGRTLTFQGSGTAGTINYNTTPIFIFNRGVCAPVFASNSLATTTTNITIGNATGISMLGNVNATGIGYTLDITQSSGVPTAWTGKLLSLRRSTVEVFYVANGGNALYQPHITSNPNLVVKAAATKAPTVSNKALTSNVATLTTSSNHNFFVGETVVVSGVDATFNGTYTITDLPSATTFTYAKTAADVASQAATGTATVSQTGNLQEWQDSSSVVQCYVTPSGGVVAGPGGINFAKSNSSSAAATGAITVNSNNQFTLTNTTGTTFSILGVGSDQTLSGAIGAGYGYGIRLQYAGDFRILHNDLNSTAFRLTTGTGIMSFGGQAPVSSILTLFQSDNTAYTPIVSRPAATKTKTVNNKALTSNVATLSTSTAHGFYTGETVVVSGVDATFDGTYTITGVPTTTTFTYDKTAANVTSQAATGTATVSQTANLQEWQTSAGTGLASVSLYSGAYGQFNLQGVSALRRDATSLHIGDPSNVIGNYLRGASFTLLQLNQILDLGNSGFGGRIEWNGYGSSFSKCWHVGATGSLSNANTQLKSVCGASTTIGIVVQAAASQTANLQEWQDSSSVVGARVDASMNFSRPGGTNSEQFGSGASASAQNGLAIGKNATASIDYCTAIGYNASAASGNTAVAIGTSASTTGNGAVCVGYSANGAGTSIGGSATSSAAGVAIGASANGGPSGVSVGQSSVSASSCVAVGITANASSQNAVAIGANVTAGAQGIAIGASANAGGNNISIGHDSDAVSYSGALAIGYQATCTANNQAIIGSAVYPTSDFYFGKGVTHATPTAVTFNGTGGSGTDIAGANIIIAGGKGTGSGVGGNILFQTSLAGASSSTLRSLTTIATISQTTQNVLIQTSAVGTIGLVVKGTASQTANLQEWQSSTPTVLSTVSENGYFTTRLNTAPADGELANGEAAYWFDSTNGAAKFMIKAKTADGTVVTGSINLT